jgi:hypothetical protein
MLKKLAAISLTAGVLLLAAPAAANAESDSYAGKPGVTVNDPIIDICDVSTIAFGPGSFQPSANVGVSVSGLNAADAAVSGNTSAADGSLLVSFRPPADGSGAYSITFTSAGASVGEYTAVITVSDAKSSCDHDPGVAAANTELPLTGDGTFELALTGGSISPWVLGGGAAALAVGGGLVVIGAARRKRA